MGDQVQYNRQDYKCTSKAVSRLHVNVVAVAVDFWGAARVARIAVTFFSSLKAQFARKPQQCTHTGELTLGAALVNTNGHKWCSLCPAMACEWKLNWAASNCTPQNGETTALKISFFLCEETKSGATNEKCPMQKLLLNAKNDQHSKRRWRAAVTQTRPRTDPAAQPNASEQSQDIGADSSTWAAEKATPSQTYRVPSVTLTLIWMIWNY